MYQVKVGDYIVHDSVTIHASVTGALERSSAAHRLKITEHYSNTILLDTTIVIPPMGAQYTIYQIDTAEGTKPLFLAGGSGDEVPADTFMQAYYVNDPIFPDVFDIKLWELQDDGTGRLVHTFKDVRKGQFTEFIPLAIAKSYILDPVKPDGQPIDGLVAVDPNDPRSGGLAESRCSNESNHQISKFSAFDFGGGFFFYYMECMFQY